MCVIGAGAAGISIALRLQQAGQRVCLLESGGLLENADGQDLYSGDVVGYPMVADIGRYRGLGGSTSRWTGRCTPLNPVDFEPRPWVRASGWPIGPADLERYYRQAWSYCAVSDATVPDEAVLAALPRPPAAAGTDRLAPYVWRFPPRGDLWRLHFGRAFEGDLRRSQDVRVLLHAHVGGFELSGPDGARTVEAVLARSAGGGAARVRARCFVLSAGGLENARILLNSDDVAPGGLGNAHDLVGRYFMQHLRGDTATVDCAPGAEAALQDWLNFFSSRRGTQHEVGFVVPEPVQREAELLNASAILTYSPGDRSSWGAGKAVLRDLRARRLDRATAAAAGAVLRHPGEAAVSAWRRALGRPARLRGSKVQVNLDLEQLPDPDSRVTLSGRRDPLGLRRLRIDWRVSDLERRTARHITEAVGAELSRLGLGTVRLAPWLLGTGLPPGAMVGTHHHIGTTRMAASPRDGVVDADCRVYGTANLFAAGSSVFPTGGHANPTLTIVALALRLADHLDGQVRRAPAPARTALSPAPA